MDLTITQQTVINAKYLWLQVPVRYGEDDMPNDAPLRVGDIWTVRIDLDTHVIEGWPQGKTLSIESMKVADEGMYTLQDVQRSCIVSNVNDYVPTCLLPGNDSDYLSLIIDENGMITNWKLNANLRDFEAKE